MKNDDRARFTLRLPTELFNLLQTEAAETGVAINALILQILWDYVESKSQ